MNDTAQNRYSTGAILLHWLIALAIIGNWLLAQYAERLEHQKLEAQHEAVMGSHFALGMTVLILSVLRIVWRLAHRPPGPNPAHKPWERRLASVIHKLFYILIIALPFTGYMMLQTYVGGMAVGMFGLFDFPGITMAKDMAANEVFHELHEIFATTMVVLFVLHVAGALKHHFADRDDTMVRMSPLGRSRD
jgi:cytochrome b561